MGKTTFDEPGGKRRHGQESGDRILTGNAVRADGDAYWHRSVRVNWAKFVQANCRMMTGRA